MCNNDTTLDLAAVASPFESLKPDEDEPKHTADVDASCIFRDGAGRYSQVAISCTCFTDGT